jgi:hypothetical protein
MTQPRMDVGYTTVVPGSGGETGGWSFDDVALPFPERFSIAPSASALPSHLTDGDLLLATLAEGVHPLIEEALRDAVRCLRADLYLPAVAMIGKAAEDAWTQAAVALARATPHDRSAQRLAAEPESARAPSFAELVRRTVEIYARQDIYSRRTYRLSVPVSISSRFAMGAPPGSSPCGARSCARTGPDATDRTSTYPSIPRVVTCTPSPVTGVRAHPLCSAPGLGDQVIRRRSEDAGYGRPRR